MKKLFCATILLLTSVVIQAEQVQIEQARRVPQGDSMFYVQFLYQGHDLTTSQMENTVSPEEMFSQISARIKHFLEKRATENVKKLDEALSAKTVTINVP